MRILARGPARLARKTFFRRDLHVLPLLILRRVMNPKLYAKFPASSTKFAIVTRDEEGGWARNGIRDYRPRRRKCRCCRRIDRTRPLLHRARRAHEMGLRAGRSSPRCAWFSRPDVASGYG